MSLLEKILYRTKFEVRHLLQRGPKVRGWPRCDERTADDVQMALEAAGIVVTPLGIDLDDYRAYMERADYARFTGYYAWNQPILAEKSLEHYLAARLLSLRPGCVYIDVASATSPTPEIYSRLFGVRSYRQDLSLPEGLDGDRIGGDAAAMPVPDGFADAMALHCSFEHFEGDSDRRFVTECARVLRPGGRVCILPLYLSTRHAVMTDPGALRWGERPLFDPDATIYNSRRWGNRHGRFYGAAQLKTRVLDGPGGMLARIYRVTNPQEIDPICYVRFALVFEQPGHRPAVEPFFLLP